jgi:S1-C subfamily serine protease
VILLSYNINTIFALEEEKKFNSYPTDISTKYNKSIVKVVAVDLNGHKSEGSGFIFDKDGHIITDYHLSVGKDNIFVTFYDGSTYKAFPVGGEETIPCGPNLLSIPKISKEKIIPLTISDSKTLTVGERVISVGKVNESLDINTGVIMGLNNVLPETITNYKFPIADIMYLNIDTNTSSYGAPILNSEGEVIGMHLATTTWNYNPSDLAFVVPSNTINKITSSLMSKGIFEHPWIGISGNNTAGNTKLNIPEGILIKEIVANSPASKSNLKVGDIIIKVDNTTTRTADDFLNYLQREKEIGDSLNVTIYRNGNIENVILILESRPQLQYLL